MYNKLRYNKEYSKLYHQKYRAVRNLAAQLKRKENKLKAIDYLGGKCFDCKQSYETAQYDFHHINPEEKEFLLGSLFNWKWGRQKEELDKCVLLCANCHRLRHWRIDNHIV